ncbi:MAG: SsrA-binding protein SmpB [Bacteroidales bacterium]|jgi:SsrA-binding protein|nr:SsrA-binding protein SmpB [Bacteroidales bacterium]
MSNTINIKNRKAAFEFFLMEEFTAGIQLTGTEIKSIRAGKASITEAYCTFIGNELFVRNMHVAEYTMGSYNNHEPKRDRKLLLTRRELRKIFNKITERGLTIIPSLLYIDEKGLAKLTIVIAKGKKLYDKRETLKHKDQQRDIDRETNK